MEFWKRNSSHPAQNHTIFGWFSVPFMHANITRWKHLNYHYSLKNQAPLISTQFIFDAITIRREQIFFYFSLRFLCTFRIAYKFLCDMLYATFSKCNSNYDDFGFYPWGVRTKKEKIKTCQRASGREKAGIYSIIPFNIFVVRSYMSFCMVYHSGFYLCVSGGMSRAK